MGSKMTVWRLNNSGDPKTEIETHEDMKLRNDSLFASTLYIAPGTFSTCLLILIEKYLCFAKICIYSILKTLS